VKFGPQYGYFPEPSKSYDIYMCKAKNKDAACQAFESFGLKINYSRGQQYLGGFIGSASTNKLWLAKMVVKWWVAAVQTLSIVAEWYPQTAYASFTFCLLQNKSHYVQRVVAATAPFFALLEEAICTHFLLSLLPLGIPLAGINGDYHQLLTHSVKMGGLAIHNPVDMAPRVHLASNAATYHLTASLMWDATWFDLGMHCMCANKADLAAWRDWLQNKGIFFELQGKDNPSVARQNCQNCAAVAWFWHLPADASFYCHANQ